jgi:tryptophan synthase alpha chain
MDLIFLLAPTSTDERMARWHAHGQRLRVLRVAQGRDRLGHAGHRAVVAPMLPRIRQHVHMPVGVGFGIRDAATAQAVGKVADAVVIGSRIIQLIEDQPRDLRGAQATHNSLARAPSCARSAARWTHNAALPTTGHSKAADPQEGVKP